MARSRYLIISTDGKKRHVNREERDHLLLSGVLKQVGPQEYLSTLKPITLHGLAALEAIQPQFQEANLKRRFLPGQFVIEYPRRLGAQRAHELLETPEAMALGLDAPGGPACKFNPEYAMQECARRQRTEAVATQ